MIGYISWYRYVDTVDAGGIGVEFEARAKKMGGSKPALNGELLDPDVFKYVAEGRQSWLEESSIVAEMRMSPSMLVHHIEKRPKMDNSARPSTLTAAAWMADDLSSTRCKIPRRWANGLKGHPGRMSTYSVPF